MNVRAHAVLTSLQIRSIVEGTGTPEQYESLARIFLKLSKTDEDTQDAFAADLADALRLRVKSLL